MRESRFAATQLIETANQFFVAVAVVEEAVVPDELELPFELVVAAELSDDFDESPPDLGSELPPADLGFAEE